MVLTYYGIYVLNSCQSFQFDMICGETLLSLPAPLIRDMKMEKAQWEVTDLLQGDVQGEAEAAVLTEPDEEKAEGHFHCCLQLSNGKLWTGQRQALLRDAQQQDTSVTSFSMYFRNSNTFPLFFNCYCFLWVFFHPWKRMFSQAMNYPDIPNLVAWGPV